MANRGEAVDYNQNLSAGRQTHGRTAIPAVGYLSDSQRPSGIERNEIVKWQRMVSERRKSSLSSSFSRAPMAAITSDGIEISQGQHSEDASNEEHDDVTKNPSFNSGEGLPLVKKLLQMAREPVGALKTSISNRSVESDH